ncbi:hypothetical protein [Bosea sp. (in: a-proteobacteria)]|uniref:hypothetical protein n=1 Tax=Bosea sp. (in: a-proteobacteria) TaxID=1871050 RepID=UPI002734F237|nr:hypothetical protein [Bosea sp. (in: a-proteobacteria)]MDP3408120.1 hypothetical protein [Bosea sp. (in: a-proteobacteria)]
MTENTPTVTFRPGQSRILPDAYFLIDGDTRMYAIVCVDHAGQPFVLVDELCGNEDIKLPGGVETGREVKRLVDLAAQGSKVAQDRLAAYAVEGIMIARGLREGANDNADLGRAA